MPLATLCKPFDDLLGGGFDDDTVSEIYGEGGSGKTNICLILARNVARSGKKVVYIDTEGLSLERLKQICEAEGDFEGVLSNLLIYSPHDLLQQEDMVKKAIKLARKASVGLIILDSATAYYRTELRSGGTGDEKRILSEEVHELLCLSRQRNVPCVITSQVYSTGDGGDVKPIGGHALWHMAKTIVKLSKSGMGCRKATLMKHRYMPEDNVCQFKITSDGIEHIMG